MVKLSEALSEQVFRYGSKNHVKLFTFPRVYTSPTYRILFLGDVAAWCGAILSTHFLQPTSNSTAGTTEVCQTRLLKSQVEVELKRRDPTQTQYPSQCHNRLDSPAIMDFGFRGFMSSVDPFVNYRFERSSGGVVNITSRATKEDFINSTNVGKFASHESIILKYAPPFIAGVGKDAPLTQIRQVCSFLADFCW